MNEDYNSIMSFLLQIDEGRIIKHQEEEKFIEPVIKQGFTPLSPYLANICQFLANIIHF